MTRIRLTLGVMVVVLMSSVVGAAPASAKTFVYCGDSIGSKVKPTRCVFKVHGSDSGSYVTGLRWRRWGSRTAVGKGTIRGNMDYRAAVTVKLSFREGCQPGGPYIYLRARFIYRDGSRPLSVRLASCDGL